MDVVVRRLLCHWILPQGIKRRKVIEGVAYAAAFLGKHCRQ